MPGRSSILLKFISAETLLALHISIRWPTSPKPVTSVTAFGLNFLAISAAVLFNVFIESTACEIIFVEAFFFFIAVDIIPVPIGLVSIILSPGLAPAFVQISLPIASPVTTNPYLGSLSSTECPPTIGIPASAALSAPPCIISDKMSFDNFCIGKPTMLRANKGLPPIAYISESEFAADI